MKHLLAVWLVVGAVVAVQAARLPNIVILYADDLGYGDVSAYNPESRIPTPHIDKLAAEGLRFTDAHSSSGICTPSRYALLTGRFHWRKFHDIVNSFEPSVFDDAELTLPELLKSRGYRTACIGKWHLGWDWDSIKAPGAEPGVNRAFAPDAFDWGKPIPGGPLAHGFGYYYGDDVPNFPPYAWFENDRITARPTVLMSTTAKTAEGAWEARPGPAVVGWDFWAVMPRLTERAVEWIGRQEQAQPFFLYFALTSPHAPIVPAPEFEGRSQAGGYGDFVVQTDWAVGRVLEALDRNGLAEETLVLFTSDNGPEHYAYERIRRFGHRSSGPLRGLKRDVYEGGHRVPFIVRWPGVVKAGEVSEALMSQVDVMASLAAVSGGPPPPGSAEDSYDMTAVWRQSAASPRRTIVHNTFENVYAVRQDHWVLIAAKTGAHTKVPPWFDAEHEHLKHEHPGELYNLADDPAQKRNLYGEMPDKVTELADLLRQVRRRGQVR